MMRKAEDQGALYRRFSKLLWYLASGKSHVGCPQYATVLAIHFLFNRYSFLILVALYQKDLTFE